GKWRALILAFGPLVFLAGLVAVLSALCSYLLRQVSFDDFRILGSTPWIDFAADLTFVEDGNVVLLPWLLALLALLFVLSLIARRILEVNLFSLHATYANRLVRCYLGASRRKARWAERWGDRDW